MVRNSYATHVTSKGQVTIPKAIRERLGLKQGDEVEFVTEDGRTIVRRSRAKTNPFSKYVGALGGFKSRKEVNAWLRELRESNDK